MLSKSIYLPYELHFTGLLQRLEEETSVNSYIAKQKLPREIETREQEVAIMSTVISEPAMGRSDLDALNSKVHFKNVLPIFQGKSFLSYVYKTCEICSCKQ